MSSLPHWFGNLHLPNNPDIYNSNTTSGYVSVYKEPPKLPKLPNVLVVAPTVEVYQHFISKAGKIHSGYIYNIVPIIDNEVTLAQIFLDNSKVKVIFLENYKQHPKWDFIKYFIDMEKECIK